jgi:3-hydroxyacyl-CoA dehydrogenase
MKIENVTVAGGGVLGSQIAFQCAYKGFNVTIWLRSEDSIKRAQPKLDNLKKTYIDVINQMDTKEGKEFNNWCRGIADAGKFNKEECLKNVENAYKNIKLETNIGIAFGNADLVIEALTENVDEKKEFYENIKSYLPEKTIVVTNSSTLLPSKLAKYTGRPDKFLALHFANSIWKNNTAEVMGHPQTDKKCFDDVVEFAKKMGMIPLPLKKEKSGYLLNSMLVPFLFSGLDLLVNDVSDLESIDKAWKLGTGAPKGPFEILDTVGLKTAYEIVLMYVKIPSF